MIEKLNLFIDGWKIRVTNIKGNPTYWLQIPCHFQWNVFSIIVLMKEFITKRVVIANMLNVIFSSRSSTQRFSFTLSWTQRNFHTNWFFEANENYFWTFCVTEQRRFDNSSTVHAAYLRSTLFFDPFTSMIIISDSQ